MQMLSHVRCCRVSTVSESRPMLLVLLFWVMDQAMQRVIARSKPYSIKIGLICLCCDSLAAERLPAPSLCEKVSTGAAQEPLVALSPPHVGERMPAPWFVSLVELHVLLLRQARSPANYPVSVFSTQQHVAANSQPLTKRSKPTVLPCSRHR
jgi:hypothetical protein